MRVLIMLLTMIMSLFSSILIGLAPCNSNCAALDQENTIEVKCKDNLIKDFGYMAVSPVEFLSTNDFYNNFNLRNLSVNSTYSLPYFPTESRMVSEVYLGSSYSQTSDYGYNQYGLAISSVYFKCTGFNDDLDLVKYFTFYIYIYNNYSLRYDIHLIYHNTSTNTSLISANVLSSSIYDDNGLIVNAFNDYVCVTTSRAWLYNAEGIINDDYNLGLTNGYQNGFDEGYYSGIERGKEIASDPASDIYQSTYNTGKQAGDAEGYQRAISQGSTAATIFSGIVTVGLLPVNVLLTMFQYEIFGINIAGLVSGFLTIAVVIIVIRFVTGKKND